MKKKKSIIMGKFSIIHVHNQYEKGGNKIYTYCLIYVTCFNVLLVMLYNMAGH